MALAADFAADLRSLRRLVERHWQQTLTKGGELCRPRRRRVTRRYSRRRILRAVAGADSLREAARRLGCAPSTLSRNIDPRVRQAVRRFRCSPPPRWFPGDQRAIATRYVAGWSSARIAAGYGCEVRHVRDLLRACGVEFAAPKARPKPCPGERLSLEAGRRERCGVMLPVGRVKRCPDCRRHAQQERRIRLRLARWTGRGQVGAFPLK